MIDFGALLFAIWVTANLCAMVYGIHADVTARRSIRRARRS
jgi:hypothetical protein